MLSLHALRARRPLVALRPAAPLAPLASLVTLAALALVVVTQSACVKVAPYERGALAHPTMTTDDVALGVDAHVRGVSEGASGGLGGGGGGCGCN